MQNKKNFIIRTVNPFVPDTCERIRIDIPLCLWRLLEEIAEGQSGKSKDEILEWSIERGLEYLEMGRRNPSEHRCDKCKAIYGIREHNNWDCYC